MTALRVLLILFALALLGAPLSAQQSGSLFCLRGAPAPECRGMLRVEVRGGGSFGERVRQSYVGTQAGGGAFVATDSTPHLAVGDWIGAEMGYLRNVDERWAVGGSVALETGNETTRALARARLRRWLTGRLYAEALPGLFRQERDLVYRSGDGLATGTGFTVEARAGFAGVAFAGARLDVVNVPTVSAPLGPPGWFAHDPGGTGTALSLGGGLEGPTALLASAAVLVIGALVIMVAGGPAS